MEGVKFLLLLLSDQILPDSDQIVRWAVSTDQ